MHPELYELPNSEALFRQAAELIMVVGREAVRNRGRFTLVLTGGSTARGLYRYLAGLVSGPELHEVFAETDFFLGDERWAPAAHPDSNGGMARRLVLEPAGISAGRIFLMPTDRASPAAAAADYEKTLRLFFQDELPGPDCLPQFDLVLLGMGEDGHVASLFPGTGAVMERKRWVTTSFPPYLPPAVERITMTMPLLNRARVVVVLATGSKKQAIVREIVTAAWAAAQPYPAALLKPAERLVWLLAGH